MRRAPAFVVALSAALVELALLAAAGNQWVYDHLTKHPSAHESARSREVKRTLLAFPWRFTPQGHHRMLWLGQIVADAGLVVVVFLLVLALVRPMRPPLAFISVFFGTWGVVVAVAQVAAIGRLLIAFGDMFPGGHDPDKLGRFWYSVFNGPTPHTVLFAGACGLIVAIVTGVTAAASSRRAEEDEDEAGPVLSAEPDDLPAWSSAIGSASTLGGTSSFGGGPTRSFGGEPSRGFSDDSTRGFSDDSTRGFSDDSTRAFGGAPSQGSGGSGAGPSSTERTAAWPPPDASDRASSWPPASPTRGDPPAPPVPPEPPAPPTFGSRQSGQPWARPGQRAPSGDWSNVTQSTTEFSAVPDEPPDPAGEPPSEVTMPRIPRIPRPAGRPPAPDPRPQSARLPLPEERE